MSLHYTEELFGERGDLSDAAFWMPGSGGKAERVVDETYWRWYGSPGAGAGTGDDRGAAGAWLSGVTGGPAWSGRRLWRPTDAAA